MTFVEDLFEEGGICCVGPLWWWLLFASIKEHSYGIDETLAGILSLVGIIAGFIVLHYWEDAIIDYNGFKIFILIVLFITILGYFVNSCINSGSFILAVILPTITLFIIFGGITMLIWEIGYDIPDSVITIITIGVICAIVLTIAYSWQLILSVPVLSIIVAIVVTTLVYYKIWGGAYSDLDKGRAFIKFGIAWFIVIFVLSVIIDLSLMGYRDRGAGIFLLSLFLNLPGTCILIGLGAKKLKSCEEKNLPREGRKIVYFGIFWLFFWFISYIIIDSAARAEGLLFLLFLFLVTIPGTVAIILIGRRLSKVGLEKGWKKIEKEREKIKKDWRKINKEKETINKEREGINKEKETINKTREELGRVWESIKENPAQAFVVGIRGKLGSHEIFLREIQELSRNAPSAVANIRTNVDESLSYEDTIEVLKDEIIKIEDEYYSEAFLEHFETIKNNPQPDHEHLKLRRRYLPENYPQTRQRRNKEWATKRIHELDVAYNKVIRRGL